MSLVVLGGQPLEELQHWVTDLFSSVPSGNGPRPTYFDAGMPYRVLSFPVRIQCVCCLHSAVYLTEAQQALTGLSTQSCRMVLHLMYITARREFLLHQSWPHAHWFPLVPSDPV